MPDLHFVILFQHRLELSDGQMVQPFMEMFKFLVTLAFKIFFLLYFLTFVALYSDNFPDSLVDFILAPQ